MSPAREARERMSGIRSRGKDFEVKFAPMSMRGARDESPLIMGETGICKSALRGLVLRVSRGAIVSYIEGARLKNQDRWCERRTTALRCDCLYLA